VNLRAVEASQIGRVGDLAAIVNDLNEGDVLFVENTNQLRKDLVTVLLPALKDFEMSIIVGKGHGARTMRLAVRPFTLIGTGGKAFRLSARSTQRISRGAFVPSKPNNELEMVELAARLAAQGGISFEPQRRPCWPSSPRESCASRNDDTQAKRW